MKKSYVNNYGIVTFMLLLISFIFINKFIYIAPNLNINIGLLIYPFTFLFLVLMYNKYGMKNAKEVIYLNFIILLIFYVIVSLLNTIDAITSSEIISENLRNIFTPNYFNISNFYIYYPDMAKLLTFSLVYFLTHYIFIITYEAIEGYSNYFLGFTLAMFIGFIIDQMLYIPLTNIKNLMEHSINYQELIRMMTASFITVIFTSVLMLIIYVLIKKRKKN